MIYLTSDLHDGHVNIIKYCNRPFKDVDEQHLALVANWNRRVGPQDHVYVLGDLAMGPNLQLRMAAFRKELNGFITLIKGNHDRSLNFYKTAGYDEVLNSWEGKMDGYEVYMRHHPPTNVSDEKWAKYDYIFHGHVHETYQRIGKCINVGVDVRDFEPKTLQELING